MFLNDTLSKNKTQIGYFYSENLDYDNDNKIITLNLIDDLIDWQNIQVEDFYTSYLMNMYQIYEYLKSKTPAKWASVLILDENTKSEIEHIICPWAYLENDTLWTQWEKFCIACSLYIYRDNNGFIVIKQEV